MLARHTRSLTLSLIDGLLIAADNALRTLSGANHPTRPCPVPDAASGSDPAPPMDEAERRHAGGLMRVNHVGEICAQALYSAQAATTRDPSLRRQFDAASRDEVDHLAWTRQRLDELGTHPSLLNPLWYAGAFAVGLIARRAGDALSLGFVVETERQVEQHLESHLERLPGTDLASRAIVEQMARDEARHGATALAAGARPLPTPIRWFMRLSARVMTSTAYRI